MIIKLKDITAMLEYSAQNKDLIFKLIHKKISENIDTDVKQVLIYEVYLTDYAMSLKNVAFRHEWDQALSLALEYFEEAEDYETCILIRDTLNRLK